MLNSMMRGVTRKCEITCDVKAQKVVTCALVHKETELHTSRGLITILPTPCPEKNKAEHTPTANKLKHHYKTLWTLATHYHIHL